MVEEHDDDDYGGHDDGDYVRMGSHRKNEHHFPHQMNQYLSISLLLLRCLDQAVHTYFLRKQVNPNPNFHFLQNPNRSPHLLDNKKPNCSATSPMATKQESQMTDEAPTGIIFSKPTYSTKKNDYRILDDLRNGAMAVVYRALCIPKNEHVAIKIIDGDFIEKNLDVLPVASGNILIPDHPNFLKHHCNITVGNKLWIEIIAPILYGVLPAMQLYIAKDLFIRASSLGTFFWTRRGIKARGKGSPCLDPGARSGPQTTELLCDVSGTLSTLFPVISPPYWVAPVAVRGKFSDKADVYSFGIVAMEVFLGRPPVLVFPESNYLGKKIAKRFQYSDHFRNSKASMKKCPDELWDLINDCLCRDPMERPNSTTLLSHPFFEMKGSGIEYLAKNLNEGLPDVKERFRMMKPFPFSSNSGDESSMQRPILGWKLSSERCELDPIFSAESVLMETTMMGLRGSVNVGNVTFVNIGEKIAKIIQRTMESETERAVAELVKEMKIEELMETEETEAVEEFAMELQKEDEKGKKKN
ncbi:serine/threonine-protein kinase BLUS1-like [Andrographis paniculata]|uniref:serine/threonine-protein kinase BLUS1-like n=1 Tax=Andrographis paniculata TaxID=175694 RepID=UPI0021E8DDEC|nr:serine/threonine-protein kinase BLUS1-like [Andrographis paniculata]